jgi:hypothetical protein
MTLRSKIRQWCSWASLMLALAALPSYAQNRRDVPRPSTQERRQERRDDRRDQRTDDRRDQRTNDRREQRTEDRRDSRQQFNREAVRPQPQFQPAPRPEHDFRQYQPPAQGHHSGQWLNQHREQPLDQQRRALENDPQFRHLPRETQQQYEQRLQRFNTMPADRQQQLLHRMETWEHLTPEQKQEFRGMGAQFNNLPPDRRRVVHSAIDTLRAMPPDARRREVESGRYNQFSPQERQILNDAARLPLAPSDSNSAPSDQQNSGQQRYVPRPPR